MGKLYFISGNITDFFNNMDVVVNAQNKYMINGSGICGAIYSASGMELLNYCKETYKTEMQPCEVRITPGFKLNIPIIHVYAPIYIEWENPVEKLIEAYKNVLDSAIKNKYKKVLLPSLGTGIHGYKHEEVATPIISLLNEYCNKNDIEIYFINRFSIVTDIYLNSYININNITDYKNLLHILLDEKNCYEDFVIDKDINNMCLYEKLIYYKITNDEKILETNIQ